jgi:tetratricopeptide (TPR) repeat protein
VRTKRRVLVAASLVLAAFSCSQRPRDPVAVARTYYLVGQTLSNSGLKQRYSLLSTDSRKVTSLDEYYQHYGATDKGRVADSKTDSITPMPEDMNLPTYRRVRWAGHTTDSLQTPYVHYYTLVNENGQWSVVWEAALLDQAEDLYRKGMLDEAIALCDKALALNPYSAAAYDKRAWCYERQKPKDYDGRRSRQIAIELNAKKAIALEPEEPDHYNTLALAYSAQNLPELKIDCYQKAIHLPACEPAGKVAYYSNIASEYRLMSKYARAKVYADSALAVDSTSAFAWMQRALAEHLLGRQDSAEVSIDRAFGVDWEGQLDKGLQFTLLFVAALLEETRQDHEKSLAHVLKALEIEPGNTDAQALYRRIKTKVK